MVEVVMCVDVPDLDYRFPIVIDFSKQWHSAWDLASTQAFLSTPYYPMLTFPRCSSFLAFLVHNMRQPLYEVRSQHTCFLRNHLLLFTLREHYFINLLWISRSNTRIFTSKVVWRCNLVNVLGQQPRYQRVASSVTMWQLFHREPSVSSRHHKLLTRQLLST